jgi:hypothetical protein
MDDTPAKECWWTISEQGLLELLRRVEAGEPADLVYVSAYANAERHEQQSDD